MEARNTQADIRWTIKAMRVNQNMTLDQAASQLCISKSMLAKLERGERRLSLQTARAMSHLYGVSLDLFAEQ